jgi:hypothetical protein
MLPMEGLKGYNLWRIRKDASSLDLSNVHMREDLSIFVIH